MWTKMGDEGRDLSANHSQEGASTVPPPGHHWPLSTVLAILARQTVGMEGKQAKPTAAEARPALGYYCSASGLVQSG